MQLLVTKGRKHTMKTGLYLLLLALLTAACEQDVSLDMLQLESCTNHPAPVAAAAIFTVNNEAYVFAGRTASGNYTNALWKYTPTSDQWTLFHTPDDVLPRVSSSACVVDNDVYLGLGYKGPLHQDKGYLRDFWKFSPATQQWTRLADFPTNTTVKNCLFAQDGAIYALYGFYREFTRDVYRYDIKNNCWKKLPVHVTEQMEETLPRAMDIVGATCQGRHFFGTGFHRNSLTFWAEWDVEKGEFVSCKEILGAGRNAASCCATNEYVYLAGGRHYGDTLTTGFFYNTVQRYNPLNNQWQYVGSLPYQAENILMTSLNERIYIGLGETPDGKIQNNWYRIEE